MTTNQFDDPFGLTRGDTYVDPASVPQKRVAVLDACAEAHRRYKSNNSFFDTEITEGRYGRYHKPPQSTYHACGDGWTYILMQVLGCQPWLNREACSPTKTWVPGDNLNCVIRRAKSVGAVLPLPDARPGDLLDLARPAGGHAAILISGNPGNGKPYTTFDINGPSGHVGYHERTASDIPTIVINAALLAGLSERRAAGASAVASFECEEPAPGTMLIATVVPRASVGAGCPFARRSAATWELG